MGLFVGVMVMTSLPMELIIQSMLLFFCNTSSHRHRDINTFEFFSRYFEDFMAKQKSTEADIDGETSLQYILDEDDSHLPLTEQRFLRILVNPIDVVSHLYVLINISLCLIYLLPIYQLYLLEV